jgi:hypothetical protein
VVLNYSSLIIVIFAKSITNAANLGLEWYRGIVYVGYYLSFVVAGVLIYNIEQKEIQQYS